MGKLSSRDRKLAHSAGLNVSNIENANFALAAVSAQQTILHGPLPSVPVTGFTTIADTVYWNYIGYTEKTLVVDWVQFIQTGSLAAGAQVCELALASTTSAPDGTAKSFNVLAVASALPDLTAGTLTNGLVRANTTALGYTVGPCTHLWAACRFDMATTQPTALGVNLDLSGGFVQVTAAHTAPLAVGETAPVGTLLAQSIAATALHPYLRVVVKA